MRTLQPAPGPVILSQERIQERIRELAAEISRDYQGRPLHLLAVLRGALPFLCDLSRQLALDVSFDFLAVTRDGPEGHVRLLKDLDQPVEGREVLLVEDIVNEGTTLKYILEALELRRPTRVRVCTMFDRPSRRRAAVQADYVGLVLDDRFVVGYGLDYQQLYRNLPYLAEFTVPD
ncbi:MAG: hypoxanthine phosphoribosyltransferase [Burkholderiales bacterium]|nr:hypoxanthine phosphoribosyltransferase [Burkholderiales bacterium]